jgi:hypothetical protein
MDPLGFEPRASSLQRRCSTAELRALLALMVLKCLSGDSGVPTIGRQWSDECERWVRPSA